MSSRNGNGWTKYATIGAAVIPAFAAFVTVIVQYSNQAAEVRLQATRNSEYERRLGISEDTARRQELLMANQAQALNEIETQFCESDHLRNLMHAEDLRKLSMLWEKTFAIKIPTDNAYYPIVCNRKARQ
jgi:hypothetical protein